MGDVDALRKQIERHRENHTVICLSRNSHPQLPLTKFQKNLRWTGCLRAEIALSLRYWPRRCIAYECPRKRSARRRAPSTALPVAGRRCIRRAIASNGHRRTRSNGHSCRRSSPDATMTLKHRTGIFPRKRAAHPPAGASAGEGKGRYGRRRRPRRWRRRWVCFGQRHLEQSRG